MNYWEYTRKINIACERASPGIGWNARFLYWLDKFDLMLMPYDYVDSTGQGMDIMAPRHYPGEQVSWPDSKIGVKP